LIFGADNFCFAPAALHRSSEKHRYDKKESLVKYSPFPCAAALREALCGDRMKLIPVENNRKMFFSSGLKSA
jgi:hypothetical protein